MPAAATRAGGRSRPRRDARRDVDAPAVGLGDREASSYRRELRDADRRRAEAYERGEGAGRSQARARRLRRLDDRELGGSGDPELDDVANTNVGAGLSSVRTTVTTNASGFVLGLLAYAVVFAYLEGGAAGVRAWFAAKFLNRVPGEQWANPASSSQSSASGGSITQPATYAPAAPAGSFEFPVRGAGVSFSDSYGARRTVMAPRGSTIVPAVSGTVVGDFTDDLGGNVVRVLGDDGNHYYYAHLEPGSIRVQPGQRVNAGSTILGGVGNSGDAAGGPTHLHFSINEGRPNVFDPYNYLRAAWDRLNGVLPRVGRS
jgi:murein DD-endopeptidase MepM/ murein hydrolase activator NlpD